MKKYLLIAGIVLSAVLFSSCSKECTCAKWEDGKMVDTEPITYSQYEIDNLNAKNCEDLELYYISLGLGYDEVTKSGIRCE
ncbi:MAG: hypothetical protein HUK15_05845 [Bacteroidales bacterium]|nr:hypothetical protein [Bacteroidales bacterium]